jgi:hypothetical protein
MRRIKWATLFLSNSPVEAFAMADSRQQFLGARLKVARAERHLRELMQTILAFLETDFAVIRAEEDGDSGTYSLKIDGTTPYPPAIPAIIGDAVHNLRSALDHIVVQFVDPESDWIGLPVAKSRSEVESSKGFRTIREMNSDFAAVILDEIQPYAGGKFKVWEIAKLDNIDKHKLLIPTVNISSLGKIDIEDERGNRFIDHHVLVEAGQTIHLAKGFGKMVKIHNKGDAGVNVLFGEDTPFPGESVFGAIGNIPELTLQAIEAFEGFCFGNVSGRKTVER